MKVLSLFSGVGAFEEGLKKANIDFKLNHYCEFDPYPAKAYSIIHNISETLNLGDINLINEKELEDFDLMTWGSPCQDFSIAGKKKGSLWTCLDCDHRYNPLEVYHENREYCPKCNSVNIEKTRSSLLVEGLRILKEKKPSYSVYENVRNINGEEFSKTFKLFLAELEDYGYNNYWQILNSKDYGVPQNRERMFVVSIRKDIQNDFVFPKPFSLKLRLKDILEEEVSEKYYMKAEYCKAILEEIKKENIQFYNNIEEEGKIIKLFDIPKFILNDNERQRRVYSLLGIAPSLLARADSPKIMNIGPLDMKGSQQVRRIYNPEGLSPTLDTMQGGHRQPKIIIAKKGKGGYVEVNIDGVWYSLYIRKLTPRECFRLMGFKDEYFDKLVEAGFSNTKLYKMAGNSIVTDVLKHIFIELFNVTCKDSSTSDFTL